MRVACGREGAAPDLFAKSDSPVTTESAATRPDAAEKGAVPLPLPPRSASELYESNVRSYGRRFPAVFARASGSRLYSAAGDSYLDFLSGCGSLNYGHSHPALRERLVDYLQGDGIVHGLDLQTTAKNDFLEAFSEIILRPRKLDYALQFVGPTGTNAVEAALKIARLATGRSGVVAFTNGFHGVSLGALGATANAYHRDAAGVPLANVYHAPYDGYFGDGVDTVGYLEKLLDDPSSGVGHPAAVIVESVPGEGGLNAASNGWLFALQSLCLARGILLIVDDIQAGCGRTGTFFSFEPAGIVPDIVTLSKSISGFGLPFALTLLKRNLDVWQPGQHNGTFRGNNLAFVTATEALRRFWETPGFAASIGRKAAIVRDRLAEIRRDHAEDLIGLRGRGLMQGLVCASGALAEAISRRAFELGLVIETSGNRDQVVKCLPPLTIDEAELRQGLDILARATADTVGSREAARRAS